MKLTHLRTQAMTERRRRTARPERSPELRLTPVSSTGHAGLTERGWARARGAEWRDGLARACGWEGGGRSWQGEKLRASAAMARLLLRASEREGESVSRGARLVAGTEEDAGGHTWWPTRARPSRRMRATQRPSSAGSPRRHGVAVRARGRRKRGRGEAGPASLAGPVGWRRPASEQPPFLFI